MLQKPWIAVASAAALLAVLAGCSSEGSRPDPTRSSSPSASASVTAAPTVYDTCIKGQATVLATKIKKDFTLEGECKTVSIVGKGRDGVTITLPAVDLLVVEGDSITATAASAAEIVFAGDHNTVTHGGDAAVQDEGSDNTATKR